MRRCRPPRHRPAVRRPARGLRAGRRAHAAGARGAARRAGGRIPRIGGRRWRRRSARRRGRSCRRRRGPGEVVVSKRHELGLLSNFAATPFVYRGKRYASVEGFWQMMLYPEGPDDPRARFAGIEWPHTRDEVAAMTAFEAKRAGELAWQNMQRMGIGWVSFEGRRFAYRSARPGRHHRLILAAMREKLRQNPEVRKVLLSTGDLVLRPDHHQEADAPPEWRYCEIWMRMRAEAAGE